MMDDLKVDVVENDRRGRSLRVMYAGSHCLGVFVDEVEAIADWRTPAPLPDAPNGVLGVVSIRGRMLTVLEATVLLGTDSGTAPAKIVALRGDEQLALAVDRTGELIEIAPEELGPANEIGALLLGVIYRAERSISVLDSKQLFAAAMRGRGRRRRRF